MKRLREFFIASSIFLIFFSSTIVHIEARRGSPFDIYDFLQCQICDTVELSGSVKDSSCDFETIDTQVKDKFHPLLLELSQLAFFRYFKVDLEKRCPFWRNDDAMCTSPDCSVCECRNEDIPALWLENEENKKSTESMQSKGDSIETKNTKSLETHDDKELSDVNFDNSEGIKEWEVHVTDDVWTSQSDENEQMVYVNLLENPERYTGYSGYQAERIWSAIYQENCFTTSVPESLTGLCLEERVYYRLISGLQASINTHIALRYKYGDDYWGLNPWLYVERVGKHRWRLENLYFTYVFVMRAIGRYGSELVKYDYITGNKEEDARVSEIMKDLVVPSLNGAHCPTSVLSGFDEGELFQVRMRHDTPLSHIINAKQEKAALELQFRAKFQNVSRIMDCVTCEKCRLWGKLQTLGLGTAIKILLSENEKSLPQLQRNELIALINVANNLARSIDGVRLLRQAELSSTLNQWAMAIFGVVAIIVVVGGGWRWLTLRRQQRHAARETRRKKAD